MSIESAGPGDGTTSAIYEVIETMGSDNKACEADPVTPVVRSDENGGTINEQLLNVVDLPAERANTDLEGRLINIGVFGKRSMNQRRVLGCLGCKLATVDGDIGAVRSMEIARCTGSENAPVRRVLARLVEHGFLRTEKRPDPTQYAPPDFFMLTGRAVEYAFKRKLQIPQACGLEQEEGIRPNAPAEAILVEKGVFATKGNAPRAVLGCLACRLRTDEGIHGKGVQRCTGLANGQSQNVISRLVDAGVLEAEKLRGVPQGGHRVIYTPADTEIGRKIKESLELPPYCGLEGKQLDS